MEFWNIIFYFMMLSSMFVNASSSGCNTNQSFFTNLESIITTYYGGNCDVLSCSMISCNGKAVTLRNVWKPAFSFNFKIDLCDEVPKFNVMLNITSPQYNATIMLNETRTVKKWIVPSGGKLTKSTSVDLEINLNAGFTNNNIVRVAGNVNVTVSPSVPVPIHILGMLYKNLICPSSTSEPTTTQTATTKLVTTITTPEHGGGIGTSSEATTTPLTTTESKTSETATLKPVTTITTPEHGGGNGTSSEATTTPLTTTKVTNKKHEGHSKPAKIVLLVLAVLIIVVVLGVYLYFRKKRRLSDQPAYYNDIALNDPLRSELDNEDERNEDDDDDELPLFA